MIIILKTEGIKMDKIFYFFISVILVLNTAQASMKPDENKEIRKKAIIIGVTGQDGAYLAEFLLNKNYEVHGIARHISLPGGTLPIKLFHEDPYYFFHIGDVSNYSKLINIIESIQPDEIYNLAAQSHVTTSYDQPEETAEINAFGTLRILEAIRMLGLEDKVKFFHASSSELFGLSEATPRTEETPFHPRSPYAVAKLYGHWITVNYRESYGIFSCNGILFNHESPLRGEKFVTRKITQAACRIKLGLQDVLYLGNLNIKRDWGYAKDYIEAMWLMLQQDKPDDYVIATGEVHSVREFVEFAFRHLDIVVGWIGEGIEEYGVNQATGEIIVRIDPSYYRPNEVDFVLGKAEKAEKILKWTPKTSFSELVKIMVEEDYKKALKEKTL
jgi:GDPmannose 4,6-dehydratase